MKLPEYWAWMISKLGHLGTKALKEWMNTKWEMSKITYEAQKGVSHDPRNLIYSKSNVLEKHALALRKSSDDETAFNIFSFVRKYMTYVGDMENSKEAEYWQNPETTWGLKKGDCEDGAILINSLMALAGIPSWKRKVCAGWVQNDSGSKGGHAYTIYFRQDLFEWFVLDWCYYPTKTVRAWNAGTPHNEMVNYLDVWFTFNEDNTWAQKDTVITWGTSKRK